MLGKEFLKDLRERNNNKEREGASPAPLLGLQKQS